MKKPQLAPCRTCQLDRIQVRLINDYPELKPVEPWKFGHLYQCLHCGRKWFLPDHGQFISRIGDELLDLAEQWNALTLTVSAAVLQELAAIGGVLDYHHIQITIPCAIEVKSGSTVAKAVVLVSRQPPHFWFDPGEVRWAGEILGVTASPYALPLEVRLACVNKREDSFGFAPVGVVDPFGSEFTLVSNSPFYDGDTIRGEDLMLSGRQKDWRGQIRPEPAEAYFFVDWFDGCAAMLARAGRG